MACRTAASVFVLVVTPSVFAACGPPGANKAVNAAIGTGLAVAAAGVNRAITHECWAICQPGTVCDNASGLCVEPGLVSRTKGKGPGPATSGIVVRPIPYESGHTYEVPPVSEVSSTDPRRCDPPASSIADAGAIVCDLDASTR